MPPVKKKKKKSIGHDDHKQRDKKLLPDQQSRSLYSQDSTSLPSFTSKKPSKRRRISST